MSSLTYGFILSLLLIVSSWLWLKIDPVIYSQQQEVTPWGQIYERENQVYFQTHPESIWQVARTQTVLSSKNVRIQSQEAAFLAILLSKKRGRLEIGENSDVIIAIKQDTRTNFLCEIEIKKGDMYMSLFGQQKQTCSLKWQDKIVAHIKNADLTIRRVEDEIYVSAHRGQIQFANKDDFLYKDMWAKIKSNDVEYFDEPFFVLTPFANDQVLQSQKARTRFKWAHAPENAQMQLWVGVKRDRLNPVWPQPIPSDKSQGFFRFPLGIYYWQITATVPESTGSTSSTNHLNVKNQYKSQVYKIFIKPEVRPILVFPNQGFTKFVNSSNPEKYKFVWLNQSRLENLFIEVAKDANFVNTVIKRPATNFGFIEFLNILPEGQYFWRVSGFRHNSSELLRSRIRYFAVTHKNSSFEKVKSWPKDGEKINRLNLMWGESQFVWDAFEGFQDVRIHITDLQSQRVQTFPVVENTNRFDIPLMPLGLYEWKVQGYTERSSNKWLDVTLPRKIQVISTLALHWKNLQNKKLAWTNGPINTDHYVILLRKYHLSDDTRSSRFFIKKVKNPQWTIDPSLSDLVSVKIRALNSQNEIIAISREKNFTL